jgi:hypothetical protein
MAMVCSEGLMCLSYCGLQVPPITMVVTAILEVWVDDRVG